MFCFYSCQWNVFRHLCRWKDACKTEINKSREWRESLFGIPYNHPSKRESPPPFKSMLLEVSRGSVSTLFTCHVVSLCLLLAVLPFSHFLAGTWAWRDKHRNCQERAELPLPSSSPGRSYPLPSQLVWGWSSFPQHLLTEAVLKLVGPFNGRKTELLCGRPFSNLAKGFRSSGDLFTYE